MSLPIQRPQVIEYLRRVADEQVKRHQSGALTVTFYWNDGAFQPNVSVNVRLPEYKLPKD